MSEPMRTSDSTEAIIRLEDSMSEVLFEAIPGSKLHLWPVMRLPLARATANSELGTITLKRTFTRKQLLTRHLSRFLPNPYSSKRVCRERRFLFIAGGTTYRESAKGRENWLIDDFAEALEGHSAILQDRALERSPKPTTRPRFKDTFTFQDAFARAELATKLRPSSSSRDSYVRRAVREIVREFDYPLSPERLHQLEVQMTYRVALFRHLEVEYKRVLDRVNPQIVLMDGASYTGRAALSNILRERNVRILEPQHGWIGPSHGAYNFGAAMSSPELKGYLPDVLLTFGDFWSENIRHPSKTVSIGKAHLDTAVAARRLTENKHSRILVASSVYQTNELMSHVLKLRDILPPNWQIVVRPHPSERDKASEIFSALVGKSGIVIDNQTDVYDSFASVDAVYGYASTVLYEALAFEIPVFVLDSPLADLYTPQSVFGERIKDDDSLVNSIERIQHPENDSTTEVDLTQIWKPGAVQNFRDFVSQY